jgi:hypothetical protein
MLEIDAWAKENDTNLYYSSNKPLLLAQMVQREIDNLSAQQMHEEAQQRQDAARQQQEAVRQRQEATRLQREAMLQQAESEGAKRASGGFQQRQTSTTSGSHPVVSLFPNGADSERRALSGFALIGIYVDAAIIVVLTFGVAWGLYWIIRPRNETRTATAFGRKWAAWTIAIATINMVPSFFRKLDGNSLALWLIGAFGWGVLAFFIGLMIGFIRYRKTSPIPIAENQPGDFPALKEHRETHEFFNSLPGETYREENAPLRQASVSENRNEESIMNTNEFEVAIPEGKTIGNGYVEMRHNTQYTLNLKNHRRVPCDADVTIDRIYVGTWRIEAHDEIRIERPVHDTGHFTFFEVATQEAEVAGISRHSDNGLVSVTFKPKKDSDRLYAAPIPMSEHSAGATGLTGDSQQRFRDAPEIEHDMARAFTIHLRLVSRRPDIRPLAPRSTPIPPPVG